MKRSNVEAKLVKDGKALSAKDVEIVVREDKVEMKLKNVKHDQSGTYQIKLSNAQGEGTKNIFINIQGNYFQCSLKLVFMRRDSGPENALKERKKYIKFYILLLKILPKLRLYILFAFFLVYPFS